MPSFELFTIKDGDLSCTICNYGATIVDFIYKNRHIVLRFNDLDNYSKKNLNPYFGATVGQFANRIESAKFNLNEQVYELIKNDGENCLHGGEKNFSHRFWEIEKSGSNFLVLVLKTKHLDEGFPCSTTNKVEFEVIENTLKIKFLSFINESNKYNRDTIINLTNHSYFNLNGCGPAEIEDDNIVDILDDHELFCPNITGFLEQNSEKIPTSKIISLNKMEEEMNFKSGYKKLSDGCLNKNLYDHTYVFEKNLNKSIDESILGVVKLRSKSSGLELEMITDLPSFQLYTGPRNKILNYPAYSGVCLEAQFFPNSCNVPEWLDQCLLKQNKTLEKFIHYKIEEI